jgi:hypothetical protein
VHCPASAIPMGKATRTHTPNIHSIVFMAFFLRRIAENASRANSGVSISIDEMSPMFPWPLVRKLLLNCEKNRNGPARALRSPTIIGCFLLLRRFCYAKRKVQEPTVWPRTKKDVEARFRTDSGTPALARGESFRRLKNVPELTRHKRDLSTTPAYVCSDYFRNFCRSRRL